MNECTSEKQAKKILDYLAKKIGYDEITIPNGTKYNYVVLSSSPCVNKRRSYSLLYSCSYRLNLGKIITTKFDTYVELLKYKTTSYVSFLPKNASIEQILIEIDLEQ